MSIKEIFGAIGSLNWTIIAILFSSILIWYAIFTIGLLPVFSWIIIIGAIIGLWVRLSGRG